MALTTLGNRRGVLITPLPGLPVTGTLAGTGTIINAVGESVGFIGRLQLESGPGTSKVFSSAGSKIYGRTGATTFANAGTNFRAGIQDVGSTGLEDGTYDVQGNFTGGGGGVVGSVVNTWAMGSGSKTIAHNDLIAVVLELTARAGADSITIISGGPPISSFPYSTADTGAGPAKLSVGPTVALESDDGTFGYFLGGTEIYGLATQAFNSGSTPDEYALVFQVPVKMSLATLAAFISLAGTSSDFELILYSDPLGTPVAERTVVVDADILGSVATRMVEYAVDTPFTLLANTNYAVAIRPTTANDITIVQNSYNTGNGNLRKATTLSTNWSQYTRSNNAGAFGSQSLILLPGLGFSAYQLENGAGGSGLNLYAVE